MVMSRSYRNTTSASLRVPRAKIGVELALLIEKLKVLDFCLVYNLFRHGRSTEESRRVAEWVQDSYRVAVRRDAHSLSSVKRRAVRRTNMLVSQKLRDPVLLERAPGPLGRRNCFREWRKDCWGVCRCARSLRPLLKASSRQHWCARSASCHGSRALQDQENATLLICPAQTRPPSSPCADLRIKFAHHTRHRVQVDWRYLRSAPESTADQGFFPYAASRQILN